MAGIVIVTGAPGTGKTTLARVPAKVSARGVHIPADLFFTFPAHPVSPYREAAREHAAHAIDTDGRSIGELAEEVGRRRRAGAFTLPLRPVASKQPLRTSFEGSA